MMSPCLALKARIVAKSRETAVGGVRSGNCSTNSFSGQLRTQKGSLTTKVLGWIISSKCVVVI